MGAHPIRPPAAEAHEVTIAHGAGAHEVAWTRCRRDVADFQHIARQLGGVNTFGGRILGGREGDAVMQRGAAASQNGARRNAAALVAGRVVGRALRSMEAYTFWLNISAYGVHRDASWVAAGSLPDGRRL